MWIKIIFFLNFISQIWQTFNCVGTVFANLAGYRRTKDLVPLFDPKVHLFENSLLTILAQLQWVTIHRPFYNTVYLGDLKDFLDVSYESPAKNPHKCDQCNETFPSNSALKSHTLIDHKWVQQKTWRKFSN